MSRRKLSSHRSKTPNPANSLGYVASRLFFDVIIRRSIRRGEKLEEVKKKKKTTSGYIFLRVSSVLMSSLQRNLALIYCFLTRALGAREKMLQWRLRSISADNLENERKKMKLRNGSSVITSDT